MKKESELINLPIIKENHQILPYRIKQLIYSDNLFRLLGFLLQPIKLTEQNRVLDFERIKEITSNHLIVYSEGDILFPDQVSGIEKMLKDQKTIIGFEVYSSVGDLIGIIKDVVINVETGKVIGFIMSEGLINDLIKGYSLFPPIHYVDLQKRCMIIDDENSIVDYKKGGLKNLLGIHEKN